MRHNPRCVFDTNVIVSAFLFERSEPGRALEKPWTEDKSFSRSRYAVELTEVLRREKFDRYLSRKKREELLKALIQEAVLVDVTERIEACRDPKDDKYLGVGRQRRSGLYRQRRQGSARFVPDFGALRYCVRSTFCDGCRCSPGLSSHDRATLARHPRTLRPVRLGDVEGGGCGGCGVGLRTRC